MGRPHCRPGMGIERGSIREGSLTNGHNDLPGRDHRETGRRKEGQGLSGGKRKGKPGAGRKVPAADGKPRALRAAHTPHGH